MPKVILSMDGQVLNEYALVKERTTIGRRPHNDIAIDNLAISGEHAVIVTILNDSFLEDLGSTNGTMVNGVPVKKHFLQTGDTIELGKYTLKFMGEQSGRGTGDDAFEKTQILRPAVSKPSPDPAPAAPIRPMNATQEIPSGLPPMPPLDEPMPDTISPRIAPSATRQGVIQVLSGGNAGREMPLTKPITTLGRPGVQVAVITKRPDGYFLTHVEGTSYPSLNGMPVSTEAKLLHEHDIIELAGVKLEFFYR
ncbi:FHA domain-containing protein [Piscinibacterium candidicorallinum]|jgi:pSer/pThr/pTyr-binding forkhead associated (FHA) protein|uniref:FHA domain-containing protein n=1 Tax=Piscinibacterium candidicorallinum TaxID=1793872 RepID=A0ABV7GY48_9BURK